MSGTATSWRPPVASGARRGYAHRFGWPMLVAVIGTGVAAGLAGGGLTLGLHVVQHLAFGYQHGSFLAGVEHAGPLRRVLALGIGGAAVGIGWWVQRRVSRGSVSVTHALSQHEQRLPVPGTVVDAGIQIVAVGAGASLGREGAARQAGAALGAALARACRLDAAQARIVLAAGAGAGLAAVYNVPLGGAAFALELLLGCWRASCVVPVTAASLIATAVAWPLLGRHPTYRLPAPPLDAAVLVAAVAIGPIAGALGVLVRAGMTRARTHAPRGWHAAAITPIAFAGVGALAIPYPELLGNGKSLAQLAFAGAVTTGTAAVLALLKPIATGACLASGAIGGLLTPSFATGATLGLLTGELWSHVWAGGAPAGYALAGAAALLAVTQRAPITAAILTLEFTHAGLPMLLPVAAAAATAHATAAILHRARPPHRALITG